MNVKEQIKTSEPDPKFDPKLEPSNSDSITYFPSKATGLQVNGNPPDFTFPPTDVNRIVKIPRDQFPVDSDKYINPGDVCCIALICIVHHRLALIDVEKKGLYMPYVSFKFPNFSIKYVLNDLLLKLFGNHSSNGRNFHLISIKRIQLPKKRNFIFRVIYRLDIEIGASNSKSKTSHVCICQLSQKTAIYWLSYPEICQKLTNLWGPEPKFVFEQMNVKSDENLFNKDYGFSCWDEFCVDKCLDFETHLGQKSQVIKCCNMSHGDIVSLFNEFVVQCYPSFFMTFCSFRVFFKKLGLKLSGSKLSRYFKSFDYQKQDFLNFHQLLLGLAVIRNSDDCQHEICVLTKHEYLFRFYSSLFIAMEDRLSLDDLCELLIELNHKERSHELIQSTKQKLSTLNCFKHKQKESLTFVEYFQLVQQNELNSVCKQSLASVWKVQCQTAISLDNIMLPKFVNKMEDFSPTQFVASQALVEQKCDSCKRTKFYLSSHFILLSEIGEVNEINRLDESNNSNNLMNKQFKQDIQESDIHVLANDLINRINKFALFIFHPEDIVNTNNDLHNLVENWFFPSKGETINYLKMIANKAEEIFSLEPRVLNLSTPCYVFGDIHGNLKDLLSFSQILWKPSPFINQSKYLFLGDYVDRGLYGVECIIYLFCMKILAPNNFFLLRGNHEIREIQEQFSFCSECSSRFNSELWDIINMAFDRLPVASVIDDKIYCAHGGIPVSVTTLDQIRSVPSSIDNPMNASIETWEILWNDPISREEFQRLSDFERNFSMESRGYARNTKRGTAYLYTDYAVQQFFQRNNLELIIRAHEVFDEGYHFNHRGMVLTVFSSSHYSDLNNHAGVIFLDRHKVRIIQIWDE